MALLVISCLTSYTFAADQAGPKKILMAGSLNPYEHKFFHSVAMALSLNEDTLNTVYLLNHNVEETSKFQIDEINERFFTIQVPRMHHGTITKDQMRRIQRLDRFRWNRGQSEEENFVDLDIAHVEAYFTKDKDGNLEFIEFLKKMNFDVGIGSLYYADSLLMRQLDLNFLKLSDEDIESWTMQFKLNMPV